MVEIKDQLALLIRDYRSRLRFLKRNFNTYRIIPRIKLNCSLSLTVKKSKEKVVNQLQNLMYLEIPADHSSKSSLTQDYPNKL